MNSDTGGIVFSFLVLAPSLLVFLLFVAGVSRLGEIRDHAKYQTKLLEQLVKNTTPPATDAAKPKPSGLLAYPDPTTKGGAAGKVALVLGLIVIVSMIIAIARK